MAEIDRPSMKGDSVVIPAESPSSPRLLCQALSVGSQQLWLEPAPHTQHHAAAEALWPQPWEMGAYPVSDPVLVPSDHPQDGWSSELGCSYVPWVWKDIADQGSLPHRRRAMSLLGFLSKSPCHRGHFCIIEAASLPFCSVEIPGSRSFTRLNGRNRET